MLHAISGGSTGPRIVAAALSILAAVASPQDRPPVFRATAEAVQFEAVVLDGRGNPVTTLVAADFEVRQDGAVVPVRDAFYVDRIAHAVRASAASSSGRPRAPGEVVEIDAEPLVFLIDDMAMSPDAFHRVQRGLRTFVAENLPAGVEIGILRTVETGRRTTTLSASRADILKRIDGLRYHPRSLRLGLTSTSGASGPGTRQRERTFLEGTLGSVNSLLADLRRLPGRKTLVLLSEGVSLDHMDNPAIEPRLNRLAQLAAEALVTVHTVDVKGVTGTSTAPLQFRMDFRDGLVTLAERMGGLFHEHDNDLVGPLTHLASLQRGYYLLSYEPPAGTFVAGDDAPFRKLSVRVKDRGLRVRARPGFFGVRVERTPKD